MCLHDCEVRANGGLASHDAGDHLGDASGNRTIARSDGLGGCALAPRVGMLRSLVQFFFQPVAISDVQHVKLLELVQQLSRRSRVVTITLPLGDDLALVGNMPLGFGNVPLSLRQMVQYQGSVWHTWPTPDSVQSFRR
jgi:hypothetical protein